MGRSILGHSSEALMQTGLVKLVRYAYYIEDFCSLFRLHSSYSAVNEVCVCVCVCVWSFIESVLFTS